MKIIYEKYLGLKYNKVKQLVENSNEEG